jgi:sec-independent protein translocase protein TatC
MPRNQDFAPDPDDMFSDTRMSFGDHLEDLRFHLIRAGIGFLVGMIFSIFFLGKPVLEIIAAPVKKELFKFQLRNFHNRKAEFDQILREAKGIPALPISIEFDRGALKKALGIAEPQDDSLLTPMMAGIVDLLHELQMDQFLDKEVVQEQRWVEIPTRIGDPDSLIRALQRLKPYIDPPSLKSFTITETFMVYFKVALLSGLVLSSPWVFYQIWAFIAAGLYPNEKKLVHVYLPFSLGLFLIGIVVCQVFVIPNAIEALLWFNEWLGFEPELRLSDWLGFAIMMPLVFGISFQTPLVMMFLNRVGIIEVSVFREHRRIAWFLMAVFAAVITPTVDAISMLCLWLPMGFLYELGILACDWQQRHNPPDDLDGATRGEELVEV